MKKIVLVVTVALIFTSCTSTNKPVAIQAGSENTSEQATPTIELTKKNTQQNTPPVAVRPTPMATLQRKPVKNIDIIKGIKTFDDLIAANPAMAHFPAAQRNDSNFIELMKDQMLISIYLEKMKDPEYLKLKKQQDDIFFAKPLWNTEIQIADDEYQEYIKGLSDADKSGSGAVQGKMQALFGARNLLIQELQGKKEYTNFMTQNKQKMGELQASMEKYWTPEMITLKNDIKRLSEIVNKTQ